jgi:hypothetical protein
MRGHKRWMGSVAVVLAAGLGLAGVTGCSGGGSGGPSAHGSTGTHGSTDAHDAAARGATSSMTVAQIKARLLTPATAPGFFFADEYAAARTGGAQAFTAPHGSTAQVCQQLMYPQGTFMPKPAVFGSQSVGAHEPQNVSGGNPQWLQWISVYPQPEAADIVAAIPGVVGRCGHFTVSAVGSPQTIRTAVTPLPGLGDQAYYVRIRILWPEPGKFSADDWLVIRSGGTLLWLIGQNLKVTSMTKNDPQTLQLATDAWHKYSAG